MSCLTLFHAPVPEEVIALSASYGDVHCNLREGQRSNGTDDKFREYYQELHQPFHAFLYEIPGKNVRLAVLFQNRDGEKLGSAVFDLKDIYFGERGYPHVRYEGTTPRKELIPGWEDVSLWGAFLLAVARVSSDTEGYFSEDPGARRFIEVIHAACKPTNRN